MMAYVPLKPPIPRFGICLGCQRLLGCWKRNSTRMSCRGFIRKGIVIVSKERKA